MNKRSGAEMADEGKARGRLRNVMRECLGRMSDDRKKIEGKMEGRIKGRQQQRLKDQ